MIPVLLALAAQHHVPGFAPAGRTHTFKKTQLSQVEYRGPGVHTFRYTCPNNDAKIFWEVMAPGPASHAPVTISASPALTGGYSRSATAGCAMRRYREGWTATAVSTVARYGSADCPAGLTQTVTVHSGGPVAFVIGEDESWTDMHMWKMPLYYVQVGAWAGWYCPWVWIVVALVVLYAASGWRLPTHVALGVVWIVFGLSDLARFAVTMSGDVDAVCPAMTTGGGAPGPAKHSDDNGSAMAAWLYLARLTVVVLSLLLLLAHCRRRTPKKGRVWIPIAAALLAAVAVVLGTGTGIWGFVVFVYYCVEECNGGGKLKGSPAAKGPAVVMVSGGGYSLVPGDDSPGFFRAILG